MKRYVNVNRQRASEDLSKESTIENVELGLAVTHETGGDEVVHRNQIRGTPLSFKSCEPGPTTNEMRR